MLLQGCGDIRKFTCSGLIICCYFVDTLDVSRGFVWILKRNEKRKKCGATYYHFNVDRKLKLISSNVRVIDADHSQLRLLMNSSQQINLAAEMTELQRGTSTKFELKTENKRFSLNYPDSFLMK